MAVADYRQVGERLGAYIRENNPSTQQIQAFLTDLLAGDELLNPVLDVVSRPSFKTIKDLSGSFASTVNREACLQEAAKSYLPEVVDKIRVLLSTLSKTTDEQKSTVPSVDIDAIRKDINIKALLNKALDRYKNGRFLLAAHAYEQVLKIDQNPAYFRSLGSSYHYAGIHEKALTAFEKALLLSDEPERYDYCNIANSLAFLGRNKEAVTYHSSEIDLFPEDQDIGDTYLARANMESHLESPNWANVYQDIETAHSLGLSTVEFGGKECDAQEWLRENAHLKSDGENSKPSEAVTATPPKNSVKYTAAAAVVLVIYYLVSMNARFPSAINLGQIGSFLGILLISIVALVVYIILAVEVLRPKKDLLFALTGVLMSASWGDITNGSVGVATNITRLLLWLLPMSLIFE
jgi:tetratricopeptide (TPR) repeat protein